VGRSGVAWETLRAGVGGDGLTLHHQLNPVVVCVCRVVRRGRARGGSGYPQERYGNDPGRLDGLLAELGCPLDSDDEDDEELQEWTFALMERITGVRWNAEFLAGATLDRIEALLTAVDLSSVDGGQLGNQVGAAPTVPPRWCVICGMPILASVGRWSTSCRRLASSTRFSLTISLRN
jgi:hypothetical protein